MNKPRIVHSRESPYYVPRKPEDIPGLSLTSEVATYNETGAAEPRQIVFPGGGIVRIMDSGIGRGYVDDATFHLPPPAQVWQELAILNLTWSKHKIQCVGEIHHPAGSGKHLLNGYCQGAVLEGLGSNIQLLAVPFWVLGGSEPTHDVCEWVITGQYQVQLVN